jgi:hypothetical protein
MANLLRFKKRFEELENEIASIEVGKRRMDVDYFNGYEVDRPKLIGWCVKAKNLVSTSCGENSEHYRTLEQAANSLPMANSHDALLVLQAVFGAAKDDFENGHITSIQSLVQAEVFSDELDQAREILGGKYKTAAAVIAGVVLETALRKLCVRHELSAGGLNKMNADLYKANVYNLLMQKRITTLADIRNNAAHGHPDQFTDADVADMIRQIESFLADHL